MTTMNNKTHGQFQDVLALAKPELRPVCEALRRLVASLHGGFVEVVWPNHGIASYGVGPKKMTQHYAYIGVQNSHTARRCAIQTVCWRGPARSCATSKYVMWLPPRRRHSLYCCAKPLQAARVWLQRCVRLWGPDASGLRWLGATVQQVPSSWWQPHRVL